MDRESGPRGDGGRARRYLDSLPTLEEGQAFRFECSPDVPCFNRCCRQLTLPLTPYDALRLRGRLGLPSDAFLERFADMRSFPDTGLPLAMLRMRADADETCPFVTPAGCRVYGDRPGACRSYPLGRGTRPSRHGVAETFYLVEEPHCQGFCVDGARDWTAAEWTEREGLGPYNAANDRYMRLCAMVAASGAPVDERTAALAVVCLYRPDRFRELADGAGLLSGDADGAARRAAVMESEEAALDFGLDWMERSIFGARGGQGKN